MWRLLKEALPAHMHCDDTNKDTVIGTGQQCFLYYLLNKPLHMNNKLQSTATVWTVPYSKAPGLILLAE